MSSLNNIFQKPEFVEDVGYIHPVLMANYDEFMECANVLTYTYDHFNLKEIKTLLETDEELKLLDLIILAATQSNTKDETFIMMSKMLSFVLRKEITYNIDNYGLYFYGENTIIHRDNYDNIRKVIMKQNIIFEPKVFKNDLVAEWAESVLKERAKNAIDISMEDMITTISVVTGKHYWDLENYTIYQIKQEFARIGKDKKHLLDVLLKSGGYEIKKIDHYAENTEIYKSPWDGIFVNKNKVKKLDNAVK